MKEAAYAKEMIEHHREAVRMSQELLSSKSVSAPLKKFAQNVIEVQSKEIQKLQAWLKDFLS